MSKTKGKTEAVPSTGWTEDDARAHRAQSFEFLMARLKTLSRAVFVLAITVFLMLCGAGGYFAFKKDVLHFAITDDLRYLPMVPLDELNLSDPAVSEWAQRVVVKCLSFNFDNYRSILTECQRDFSESAYKSFMQSLQANGTLDALKDKNNAFMKSTNITNTPIVANKGMLNGRYVWRIEVPVMITDRSVLDTRGTGENFVATVAVMRVSELENPAGVKIGQIVFGRGQ